MFLAAVARPRFDKEGNCTFDGKIGLWPFAELEPAERRSINRPDGTLEWKPESVNKSKYKEFIIEKVIPAIKQKWPGKNRNVIIQQDGASSHLHDDDPDFVDAATAGNWRITLRTQPAQSPDCNILDLGFFRSLQAMQFDEGFALNTNGLVDQVLEAFQNFHPIDLDNTWVTLQTVWDQIILSKGSNNYKIPHIGKETLRQQGLLEKYRKNLHQ